MLLPLVHIILFLAIKTVHSIPLVGNENCIGRPNGQYVSGYGCNRTYTQCLYGFTIVKLCDREHLAFGVYEGKCIHAGSIEECYHPKKEYEVMRPAKCAGEPNKCHAEGPCSNNYSCCIDGIPQEKRCPKQYDEFDNARNKCVRSDCIIRDGSFGHPIRMANPFDIEEMMDVWAEAAKRNRLWQK